MNDIILCTGNGSLVAEKGLLTGESAKFSGSLDISGAAHVEDAITIGSTFALTSSGMYLSKVSFTTDEYSHTSTPYIYHLACLVRLTTVYICLTTCFILTPYTYIYINIF